MQKSQKSQASICDSDKIKQRLKLLQDTLDITQEEMARLGGRKRVSFAEYVRENNPKMPGADFIANLVLNTGVNANWLLTGQGEMFSGESPTFNSQIHALLAAYKKLPDAQKILLLELANALANSNPD